MSASVAPQLVRNVSRSPSLGPHLEAQRTRKVLSIFGTRPEVIKLAPVIRELESRSKVFRTINVSSCQHTTILDPFVRLFDIRVDHALRVMRAGPSVTGVCARALSRLGPVLEREKPEVVIVQGDTTSALTGALAAFYQQIPVAHIEAGLRSGCDFSPFPEEMNRKLITRLATYHFASTSRNRDALLSEGVAADRIFVTGNPVVDALHQVANVASSGEGLNRILKATTGSRRVVLTTHRREAFGRMMLENLKVVRDFVNSHKDVTLIFPVHPNPQVVRAANQILAAHPRIHVTAPLGYANFIRLLSESWLIVSDSGGIQEEAPSLGKPLLIIRDNTERPEAVESGIARLVGGSPAVLAAMLEDAYRQGSWVDSLRAAENPFGRGDAARCIVDHLAELLTRHVPARYPPLQEGYR